MKRLEQDILYKYMLDINLWYRSLEQNKNWLEIVISRSSDAILLVCVGSVMVVESVPQIKKKNISDWVENISKSFSIISVYNFENWNLSVVNRKPNILYVGFMTGRLLRGRHLRARYQVWGVRCEVWGLNKSSPTLLVHSPESLHLTLVGPATACPQVKSKSN